LPHMGSATVATRLVMAMRALDNIDAVLAGRPAPSLVTSRVKRDARSFRLKEN
jgi:lactate dehydrogenase-like 2-hydroxyacid dehydrogenase